MLTNKDANTLSQLVSRPDMFPEARKELTRALFDYYKEILYREPRKPIPTARRMF